MLEQFVQDLTKLTWRGTADWFLGAPLQIVVVVLIAVLARWVLLRSIGRTVQVTLARADARREQEPGRARRALASATGAARERHRQRTLTMGSLLRSTVTFVIALIAILTVMGIVGINLAPVLATAGLLRVIWVANSMDVIFVMTGGGPGYATHTLPLYAFVRARQNLDFGYGTTIAVTFTILLGAIVAVYLARTMREVER